MNIKAKALLATLVVSCAAQAQTKWDVASPFVPTNFHEQNLAAFASEVDKATAGQLRMAIHSNSSLFKGNEIKRALQGGQVQVGQLLMVAYENENPILGVDGVPFLAPSYQSARSLYLVQKPQLQKYLKGQGLILLYCVPWPASGVYSKKPVNAVVDMRGIKWRAYSPATAKMGELMGAQPVTIQASELSQALATGVVEAFMTSSQTGVDSRVYEQVGYFYDVQASLPKNAVIVNAHAFEQLGKSQQAAILEAAARAEDRGWKLSQEWDEASKKTLKEKGMTVAAPSAKLAADLEQLGRLILQDWLKKAGAEGEALVAEYQRAVATSAATPAPRATSGGKP